MIRSAPAEFGLELDEGDPFFNYRATNFIVENGVEDYFSWHDELSWHPVGRNVSETSQTGLHLTAAFLYKIFGAGLSVYEFTIFFPVVFGSLTCIVIFALVRTIAGTTAGLFASLLFSIAPIIIVRGSIGWFKSEPLGLFLGILSLYLFLSALKTKNRNIVIGKLIAGGFSLGLGIASWGGVMFFVIPLGLFFIALPFLRKDHSFLVWTIPLFVGVTIVTGFLARPGVNFSLGLGGFTLIAPSVFLIIIILIQKMSSITTKIRNSFIFLGVSSGSVVAVLLSGIIPFQISPRYISAVNPFYEVQASIFSEVVEHILPTLSRSLPWLSVLVPFAGLGIWLLLKEKNKKSPLPHYITNEMIIFALIFGFVGAYVGATLFRLMVFSSLAVIVLASIGLALLTTHTIKKQKRPLKMYYVAGIVCLLILPAIFPIGANWLLVTQRAPLILTGWVERPLALNDFLDTMEWIKANTPSDSVIVAWWDYGYPITALAERKTVADAATFPDPPNIEKTAEMFLSPPEKAFEKLKELDADYVLIVTGAEKVDSGGGKAYYRLAAVGDHSFTHSIIKIAGEELEKFYVKGLLPNTYFWENTLLGKMIPIKPDVYFEVERQGGEFEERKRPILLYEKIIEYDSQSDGPLRLVYSSPSLDRVTPGPILAVLVYEVNDNFESSQEKLSKLFE